MKTVPTSHERVADLETRVPVCIRSGASLREVARRMAAEGVGVVIVGRPEDPRGIISERDLVARLASGADPDATTVDQAMTGTLVSARPADRLYEVAIQMLDDEVRHIPVVDAQDRVTGVVSIRDLLRPLILDALDRSGPAEA